MDMAHISYRRLMRWMFILLVMVVLVPHAGAQFEGIVESKNITTDEKGEKQTFMMTLYVRKDMVKVRNSAIGNSPPSTMIYRNDKRVVWMLNEDEKTYFEIPQGQSSEELHPPSEGRTNGYKMRRTGKTKRVLGYTCEQIFFTREDEETQIWGTKSLGHLSSAISKALGEEHAESSDDWTNELLKMGMFPLISTTKIQGSLAESQEVTLIEKKTLPEELFALPPEYRKQRIGEMLEDVEQK